MTRFHKYHGLGNDFIIIDRLSGGELLSAEAVVAMCARHRGIGADGVLTVWSDPDARARMQVQNADGSTSDMCGNGLRCVARYLYDANHVQAHESTIILRAGKSLYPSTRVDASHYQIDMGEPVWSHAHLPSEAKSGNPIVLTSEGRNFVGTAVHFGNPHFVVFCDQQSPNDDTDPMLWAKRFGPALETHKAFAQRTNVSFVVPTPDGFRAVVHERGVGITQACGSGACAVGVAAIHNGRWSTPSPLNVGLPGGKLAISLSGNSVLMQGEACFVYSGEIAG